MSQMATPSQKSEPPKVTMNDGTFNAIVIPPWIAPMAVVARTAKSSAAHHGHL